MESHVPGTEAHREREFATGRGGAGNLLAGETAYDNTGMRHQFDNQGRGGVGNIEAAGMTHGTGTGVSHRAAHNAGLPAANKPSVGDKIVGMSSIFVLMMF